MTISDSLAFQVIDHTDEQESERIRQLFFDSYSVEAQIIDAGDFPPLRRTDADIRVAEAVFHGAFISNRLSAAAELEHLPDGTVNIAGFAVHPELFRRGIGARFLGYLIHGCEHHVMTVSTAVENGPAIALYRKFSFFPFQRWETPCGIEMVSLRREKE